MKTENKISVKFAKGGLYEELKAYVEYYFASHKLTKTGNIELYSKAIIISFAFIGVYFCILFAEPPTIILLLLFVMLGFIKALIGFNIMHDSAHGSFSKHKWINSALAYSADLLGGSKLVWNLKHNILHHTYTNIEGGDEDFEIPFINIFGKYIPKKFQKYQHIYAHVLYLFTSFSTHIGDYRKYFKGTNGRKLINIKTSDHVLYWSFKFLYYLLFIFIPIYLYGWIGVIGFVIIHFVFGYIMAIVFQPAHLVPKTYFIENNYNKIKAKEWCVHEIETTCNFARGNKVVSWLLGGLNYQIEHHLFTNISHIHYPKISQIVGKFAKEHRINFNEYRTFIEALKAHFQFLKSKGQALA